MILTLKAILLHTKLNLSMLSVESEVKDLKHNSQYKCNHFRFVELNCIKFEFHKEKNKLTVITIKYTIRLCYWGSYRSVFCCCIITVKKTHKLNKFHIKKGLKLYYLHIIICIDVIVLNSLCAALFKYCSDNLVTDIKEIGIYGAIINDSNFSSNEKLI